MPCRGPDDWELLPSELQTYDEGGLRALIKRCAKRLNKFIDLNISSMNKEELLHYYFDVTNRPEFKSELAPAKNKSKERPSDESHSDWAVRLLCSLCDSDHLRFIHDRTLTNEMRSWYDEHKEYDKQRLRKQALAKLTDEEKEALGL